MDRNFIYHGAGAIGTDESKEMGPLAEAVDVFFDRVVALMPKYVSRLHAMLVGLAAAAVVLLLVTPAVVGGYLRSKEADATPRDKTMWLVVLAVGLVVSLATQVLVSDIFYRIDMIQANKQHFANVHWTSEYVRAVRAGKVL